MGNFNIAYAITTYHGHRLVETIHSIPLGARLLVMDTSILDTPKDRWSLARTWNVAIEQLCGKESHDAVIVCNDDIILREDTGDLLANALLEDQFTDDRPEKDRKVMLVSAYNTRDLPDQGPRWGTGPDYSCFACNLELLDHVGPFDENFYPAYFEDNDSHRRINMAGFSALSYAPYYHHGSQTANGPGAVSAARRNMISGTTFELCKAYYVRKHGGPPGYETYRTPFGVGG